MRVSVEAGSSGSNLSTGRRRFGGFVGLIDRRLRLVRAGRPDGGLMWAAVAHQWKRLPRTGVAQSGAVVSVIPEALARAVPVAGAKVLVRYRGPVGLYPASLPFLIARLVGSSDSIDRGSVDASISLCASRWRSAAGAGSKAERRRGSTDDPGASVRATRLARYPVMSWRVPDIPGGGPG